MKAPLTGAVLAAALLASAGSSAQYGRTQSGPVYYGPTETQQYRAVPPGVGEAPEWISHMSPRCAALNDALRTANARGLAPTTVSEMRRNYQRECAEDESDARNQWGKARGEQKTAQRSEAEAQKRTVELTRQQQQQCDESKRILITKKRRTDLTDGEKADLQRFEANYHSRCG